MQKTLQNSNLLAHFYRDISFETIKELVLNVIKEKPNKPRYMTSDNQFKTESEKLYHQLKDLADNANGVRLSIEFFENEPTEEDDKIIDEFYSCFNKLQKQSLEDNFYWKYCPIKVYETTFKDRMKKFFDIAIDANKFDFVCEEIKTICNLDENHQQSLKESFTSFETYFFQNISYTIEANRKEYDRYVVTVPFSPNSQIETTQRRKIEYLLHLIPDTMTESKPPAPVNNFKKIQTNISVEQLALLFRILKDENIIDKDTEVTNLSRAISSIFSTKKAEDISPNSIKNHFDTPTTNAIEFWQEKRQRIQILLKKYKEK